MQSQKLQDDLCSFPRQTTHYHNNPNLCPNHSCQRSWSWMVLWRPSKTNTRKRCPFHHRGLGFKSRKSRDTWSNRQVWPWSTEWSRAKANRILPRENTLVRANTLIQQHKRWLYTWTSPDGQYRNQIDYILCSQRWRSSIQSAKIRPRADCGSDHEFPIAKFILKWKKVEKTIRPFRYWKVVAESRKDAGVLGLRRRIQSGARDKAGSLRAFM